MSAKRKYYTDPSCGLHDGEQRVAWVQFEASQVFSVLGGKAVQLNTLYRAAVNNASNLAGFLVTDKAGATGGHPASIAVGDELPVDFGLHRTCVFPTTGRAALDSDRGFRHTLRVISNKQYVEMNTTNPGVLQIEKVLDEGGKYVSVSIPTSVRYGNV